MHPPPFISFILLLCVFHTINFYKAYNPKFLKNVYKSSLSKVQFIELANPCILSKESKCLNMSPETLVCADVFHLQSKIKEDTEITFHMRRSDYFGMKDWFILICMIGIFFNNWEHHNRKSHIVTERLAALYVFTCKQILIGQIWKCNFQKKQ